MTFIPNKQRKSNLKHALGKKKKPKKIDILPRIFPYRSPEIFSTTILCIRNYYNHLYYYKNIICSKQLTLINKYISATL